MAAHKKPAGVCVVLTMLLMVVGSAAASDIAFYVGAWNFDGWYDVSQFDDVQFIIGNAGASFRDIQQFDDDQFPGMESWVSDNTDDSELDVLWLNGCMPSVLYGFPNLDADGSLIETWLDDGNMIINVGDWFGYVSYECGGRCAENGATGAANILDLSSGIIVSADGTQIKRTAAGEQYMPVLDSDVTTDRPISIPAVVDPWEVAEAFASDSGDADGSRADPIVIHNTETGAYVAFINQKAGGLGSWIPRGTAVTEFINNWMTAKVDGFLDVHAHGKAAMLWASIKLR